MRDHHDILAGVAQQGDRPGLVDDDATEEGAAEMSTYDMPLINIAGYAEMTQVYPVNTDAPYLDEYRHKSFSRMPMTKSERIASWKRRLLASRCAPVTDEEMEAAASGTKAEKMLGFPCTHSETMWVDGLEVYIGDVRNLEGKDHLRMVCIENLPHTTCDFMHTLSWSFLRRFQRDRLSGKIIDLDC